MSTVIVTCYVCSNLFLSGALQKTKVCPYCGKRVNLQKVLRVAQATNAVEASELLKQLKFQKGNNKNTVDSNFRCV